MDKYAVSFTQTFIVEAEDKDDAIFKGRWIFNNPASVTPTIRVELADKKAELSKDRFYKY